MRFQKNPTLVFIAMSVKCVRPLTCLFLADSQAAREGRKIRGALGSIALFQLFRPGRGALEH